MPGRRIGAATANEAALAAAAELPPLVMRFGAFGDMVLLTVAKLGRPVVEMTPAAVTETEQVATIGFPGKDPVNNPLFLSGVFGNDFGVKRAVDEYAVMTGREVDLGDNLTWFIRL